MGIGAPTELLGHAQWMLLESESEELYCITLFFGNISITTNSSSSTVKGVLSFCLMEKKNSFIQPDENRLIQTVKNPVSLLELVERELICGYPFYS